MLLPFFEHLGIFVFAISGLLMASDKKLDYFGGMVIAFFVALGGGTIRDILLNTDVLWMQTPSFIYTAMAGALVGILFQDFWIKIRKTFFLFDTIGMGLFTILGIQKGIEFGQIPITCLLLGLITATFGGVIRDVLCNKIPLIFRKEIYATAGIIGGIVYLTLHYFGFNNQFTLIGCILIIVAVRIMSVVFGWRMPVLQQTKKV
jgi:uncharacterized membrane protein YeiH